MLVQEVKPLKEEIEVIEKELELPSALSAMAREAKLLKEQRMTELDHLMRVAAPQQGPVAQFYEAHT